MATFYDNTWIKLPRSFTHWQWYHNSNMVHLYLYLLLKANVSDEARDGRTIHRGELLTTIPRLVLETSLSMNVVRLCLKKLEKTKEIRCKTFNKGRVIILLDFNTYQTLERDDNPARWTQLYRNITRWGWYSHPKMVHFLIHVRLQAYPVALANGISGWQYHGSLKGLYEETGISIKSLRTCIDKLKETGEINYARAGKGCIITVCRPESYATSSSTNGKLSTCNNTLLTNSYIVDYNKQAQSEGTDGNRERSKHSQTVFTTERACNDGAVNVYNSDTYSIPAQTDHFQTTFNGNDVFEGHKTCESQVPLTQTVTQHRHRQTTFRPLSDHFQTTAYSRK